MIVAFALCTVLGSSHAAEFTRQSAFDSVESFVAAAKAFQPAVTEGELSSLFMIPEMGETNHGTPISASAIQSCDVIWSDEAAALLIAVASPPTEATRSCVGGSISPCSAGQELAHRRPSAFYCYRQGSRGFGGAYCRDWQWLPSWCRGHVAGCHRQGISWGPRVRLSDLRVLHVQRIQAEPSRVEMTATSNQATQPTGGRFDAPLHFMKIHPLQSTLALGSDS